MFLHICECACVLWGWFLWWMTNDSVCVCVCVCVLACEGGGVGSMCTCESLRETQMEREFPHSLGLIYQQMDVLMYVDALLNTFKWPLLISQVIRCSGRNNTVCLNPLTCKRTFCTQASSTEQIPEACGPHPSLRVAASTFRFVTVIYVISAAVKVNCPAPWYFINDLQITAEREKKKKKKIHTCPGVCSGCGACHFSAPLSRTGRFL